MRWWFLKFVLSLMPRKSNAMFLLASLKTLTNFRSPSSYPLQRACCGFQKPACDSKTSSGTRLWFWKLFCKPPMTCIFRPTFLLSNKRGSCGENRPMTEIVSRRRTVIRLSVQVSEFVSVSIEANKIFAFNIFFNRPTKKFNKHWRIQRKYWCT